jgi:hypothetical protein
MDALLNVERQTLVIGGPFVRTHLRPHHPRYSRARQEQRADYCPECARADLVHVVLPIKNIQIKIVQGLLDFQIAQFVVFDDELSPPRDEFLTVVSLFYSVQIESGFPD